MLLPILSWELVCQPCLFLDKANIATITTVTHALEKHLDLTTVTHSVFEDVTHSAFEDGSETTVCIKSRCLLQSYWCDHIKASVLRTLTSGLFPGLV